MTQRGFTLPELLIAVMIASMVIGSLAGVSGSAARAQARDYRHGTVGNNLAFGIRYMQADIERARRVYTGESTPGTAVIDSLCLGICDLTGVGGVNCNNAFKDVLPTGNLVTLNYVYYCRAQDSADQVWKLYRDDSKTGVDTGTCPSYGACGSASGMMTVASNIDKLSVKRLSAEYNRDSVEIRLDGSWYSASTGANEDVHLTSQVTFPGSFKNGP